MSAKQDRARARTATDLEYRYNFGKSFAEVLGIATDARDAAESAQQAVGSLDSSLNHEEIFNRLTDNGTSQAIYREDGNIYINASYIKSGSISSDLIKAGVIRSTDYKVIEVDHIYPGVRLYPAVRLYPNDGNDISQGIEIDFAAGVIRGILESAVTKALAERIAALEKKVFG